jgi:uncharacterized protein YbbC (DUF1343 family)
VRQLSQFHAPAANFVTMEKVLFGVDAFCMLAGSYKNTRFALVTNNAATTSDGIPSRIALLKAGFKIVTLFSPEHGLTAKGDDGAYQNNHIDSQTQLPVTSLYGDHLMPTAADMTGIDAMLFDIPDAGCRFYTYLWTMTYTMEACAKYNKPFIVLDRPNPTGGNIDQSEGPMLDEINCSSFTGRWNIPLRHSCTLGELAAFFSATRINNLDLHVIKVQYWNRKQTAAEAGWYFVPTSPAVKDPETLLLYPGMGLFEGINVNEGRGTGWPFKIIGAPWINAPSLHTAFTNLHLPGIISTGISYTPACGLYGGEQCHGLQFSVTDIQSLRPVKTGLVLIHLIISLYAGKSAERLYPTVANPSGKGHLDKLTGIYQSFEKIKMGNLPSTTSAQKEWPTIIQPYLLY